jgi:hypothetical protein
MNLIQLLQEASSAPLEDVKNSLKKDPNTKVLFQSVSTLDSVKDKGAFLATVKYHLLNNKNVINFAKSRSINKDAPNDQRTGMVKNISSWHVFSLRKLRAETMNASNFSDLKAFVKDLFAEHTVVQKGTVSASTRKELSDWVNGNGRHFNLSRAAIAELTSIPNIKSTEKVTLYRGVLFKKFDLEKKRDYSDWNNEKMVDGNGLAFIKQIRQGTKILDLDWDKPSSWSIAPQVAERFAKYGAADSSFGATMQWLQRGADNREIDGELGFVFMIQADPEDVIIDMEKVSDMLQMNHGGEGEVILKPGKYFAKIVKRYTVRGEVDPKGVDVSSKSKIVHQIHYELQKLQDLKIGQMVNKVPKSYVNNEPSYRENTFEHYNIQPMLSDDFIKRLKIVNSMTDEIHAAFEKFQMMSKELNTKYKDVELTSDMVDVSNDEEVKRFKIVQALMKKGNARTKSSHFGDKREGPLFEIPRDKLRMSLGEPPYVKELGENIRRAGGTVELHIGDKDLGIWFDHQYKKITGKSISSRFDMLGNAKQKPAVELVLKDFFGQVDIPYPEDYKEALIQFRNILVKYYRNLRLLDKLRDIDYVLSGSDE